MKYVKESTVAIALASLCMGSTAIYAAGPITVGETEVSVGGYIKADLISSDVDSSNNGAFAFANQLVAPGFIPLEGSAGASQDDVSLHGRESRLIVSTKNGDMKTKFEGDFFGAQGNERFSNSHNFRLRVAWAEFGKLGFGQNWSAAVIFPSFVDQINFSGFGGGYTAIRQASIRYTSGPLVLALENPETTISNTGPGPTSVLQDTDSFPDAVARYNLKMSKGVVQGAVVGRKLSNAAGDLTTTGVGIIVGGAVKLGAKDDLKFLLGQGALGRYMADNLYADAEIVNGKLKAVDISTLQLAYRHFWADGIRSTLMYSQSEGDNDISFAGSKLNKKVSTVMANLLWDVSPKTTWGLELSSTERKIESNAKGELNRVQFSLKQKF